MSVASGIGKIHVLPEAVVSRIAAGEVVERPAAVVKELIENSLDAGSSRILIEVIDGGRQLIRVIDDGEGMSRADAQLAFQRHATSKIFSDRDLLSITTMGFRGEALPSIASVSKVMLITACREEPVGVRLTVAGGKISRVEEAAAAPGTQIEVTDLFYNTPARKKFLKTSATEFAHICLAVQHAALATPEVQFRLKHNGQEVFDYPPVVSLRDRLLQIYGSGLVKQMVPVRAERPGLLVEGYTIQAVHTRTGRSPQEILVNRRPVRNATIMHAVYEGYGVSLAKGRHPVYVLALRIDPARVDVNVHPTKREVRFADQEMIYQTVRQAVREAVSGINMTIVERAWQPLTPEPSALRDSHTEGAPRAAGDSQTAAPPAARNPFVHTGSSAEPPSQLFLRGPEAVKGSVAREPERHYALGPGCEILPLGQIHQTFLVAQVGAELQVIDQHTAHERVLFERLWRAWLDLGVSSQPLLIPEPVEVPPHCTPLLQQHLADLAGLGLEIEPFGGTSFVIRAIPALLGSMDYTGLIQDVLEELAEWSSRSSLEARIRPVLATMACHSAVRAGRGLQIPEMKRLIEDWIEEGLPATCPHGRRIALRLPADELAKIFGR